MRTAPKLSTSLALVALSLVSSGCVFHIDNDGGADFSTGWGDSGETLRGSGVAASEVRQVEAFSSIEVNGAGDAHVVVSSERSVQVTADDNLIEHVRTHVVDGRLVLELERGSYSFKTPLHFEIRTPTLESISISGAGDAQAEGLDSASFEARIAGSGTISASGRCDELEASIAGSGDLMLLGLEARVASVRIAGSGNARVNASEVLDANIAGSGDVRYRGAPRVTKSVAGSGSVARD